MGNVCELLFSHGKHRETLIVRITNLNPDSEIGASAWHLEIDGYRLLMDAGTHPKRDGMEGVPLFDKITDKPLDAIALTHCHHDHVGSLPVAMKHFPEAHVLMSELSYFIVERVLHNSVNVMQRQKDEQGIEEYPLYTHQELDEMAPLFQGFRYNQEIEWASFDRKKKESPTLEFFDAGHALGSAGVMVRGEKETVFYTGDVCFSDQTLLRGARFDDVKADVLIMETTRGTVDVPKDFTREKEMERFAESVQKGIEGNGCVLIPTFALGRTQEILATLALMMNTGKLRRQPVYIGGLGKVFTEIYDLQAHRANRNHTNLQLREALNLIVLDKNGAERMKLRGGRLFVITAGMMTDGTTAHDIAARMIGEEDQSIFFVGYADPASPAGKLRAAEHGETFVFSGSAGEVTRRCDLKEFDLTAHANRDELLDLVDRVDPKVVVLTHGEKDSVAWFKEQIEKKHPKIQVKVAAPGETLEV